MRSIHGFLSMIVVMLICVLMVACQPVERTAYDTVVASKAFLQSEYAVHPECKANDAASTASTLCVDLAKAVSAKDALIDALGVYCSGSDFTNGGACQPPVKGTPASDQATAKLKAAIAAYNQTASDVKGIIKP